MMARSLATEELHTFYSGTDPYRTLSFHKIPDQIYFNTHELFFKKDTL